MIQYFISVGVLIGLLLICSMINLVFWSKNIEKSTNLSFFFFGLISAAYLLVSTLGQTSQDVDNIINTEKALNAIVILTGMFFVKLTTNLTNYNNKLITVLYNAIFIIYFIVNLVLPYGISYSVIIGTKEISLSQDFRLFFPEGNISAGQYFIVLLVVLIIIHSILAITNQRKSKPGYNNYLFYFFTIIGLGGILSYNMLLLTRHGIYPFLENLMFLSFSFMFSILNFKSIFNISARINDSEEKMKALFENSNDSILILKENKFWDCNTKTLEMFSCTRNDVIGNKPGIFSPKFQPDGTNSIEKAREKISAAQSGINQYFEWVHSRSDGSPLYTEVSLNKIDSGSQDFIYVIIRDLTLRKKSENELRLSEEKFSKAFQSSPDAMILTYLSSMLIEDINKGFETIFEYSREEVLGKGLLDIGFWIDPGDRNCLTDSIKSRGRMPEMEARCMRKSGELMVGNVSAEMINTGGENLILTVFRDITDKKKAEKALKESEQRNRIISELTTDYIFVVEAGNDGILRLIWASDNLRLMTGRTLEDASDSIKWASIIHEDDYKGFIEFTQKTISKLEPNEFDCRSINIDGTQRWIRILVKPQLDDNTKKIIIVGAVKDITDSKLSEEALRLSEEKFSLSFRSSPDSLIISNLSKGIIIDVNDGFERVFGYSANEAIGAKATDLGLWANENDREKMIELLIKNGYSRDVEVSGRRKSGEIIDILLSMEMFETGNEKLILTVARDISERKKSEEFLSLIKYSIDNANDYIYWIDDNANIKFVNNSVCKRLGYEYEEIISKTIFDINPFFRKEKWKEHWTRILNEKSFTFEAYHESKNGERFPVEITTNLIKFGNNVYNCAITRDITERKRTEEKLKENEEKFRIAFDNAPTGMSMIKPDGKYLAVNPVLCKMFGYTEEELLSGTINIVTHPDDIERGNQWIKKMISGDYSEPELEKRYIHKNGKIVWGLVRAKWIKNADESVRMSINHILDITQRKEAEEALKLSEAYNKLLFRESHTPLVVMDSESLLFIDCNEAAVNIYGFNNREDILGRKPLDVSYPTQYNGVNSELEVNNRINDALEKGSIIFEWKHRRPNGEIWDGEVHLMSFKYKDKDLLQFSLTDITERKLREALLKVRMKLMENSNALDMNEFLRKTLDEAVELTQSVIGFYHFLEDDQKTLSLQAWSTSTINEFCNAEGTGKHYNIDEAGVWVDCVRQRKPVIHNDYSGLKDKKGLPAGHADVIRELIVPIFRDDKIISIMGVGNKQTDYNGKDLEIVSYIADITWEITVRKRAEEEIQKNNRELEWLMKSMANSFVVWGIIYDDNYKTINLRFEYFNDSYERESGFKLQEVRNKLVKDVWPETEPEWFEIYNEVALTGNTKTFEMYFSSTNATYMCTAYRPWNSIDRVCVVFENVTERKRAAEALKESEENLRITLNSIGDAVIATDINGRVMQMNPVAESLTGWLFSEAQGVDLSEIFYIVNANTREIICNPVSRVLETGEIVGLSNHTLLISRNGDERQISDSAAPIFNKEGSIVGVVLVFRDITEEYLLQAQIRQREEQFRTVFENAPYGITISRLSDGAILKANPRFLQASGYTEEEIIGKSDIFYKLNENDNQFANLYELLIKKGNIQNQSTIFYTKSGDRRDILFSAATIDFEGEKCIVSLATDVTETRKLEEQLRQSQKMDVIGQLAGGIAHDFNNMLAGILGSAEIISYKAAENDRISHHANSIIRTAKRAGELTQKLLTFSRVSKSYSTVVDIHNVLNSSIQILQSSIDKKINIEIKFLAENPMVLGDQTLLQNAFLNIAINSRDAMPEGGTITFATADIFIGEHFPKISSNILNPGNYIEVEITDNGKGIEKHTIEKIFEPFFTTKPVGKGTGLGLSIVYGTIKDHQGAINVSSEIDIGTSFKIYLPVQEEKELISIEPEESIVTGKGLILVVDDEELIRNNTSELLANLGYNSILAKDGEEAIEIIKKDNNEIRLVLLDMVMPKLSGRIVFEKIKKINPGIKVIFCTGFSNEENINEMFNLGVSGLLQKPYTLSSLSGVIARTLKK